MRDLPEAALAGPLPTIAVMQTCGSRIVRFSAFSREARNMDFYVKSFTF